MRTAVPVGVRRRLRPLRRNAQRLRERGAHTTGGTAISLYKSEGRPLRIADAWRLSRLQRPGDGRSALVALRPRALGGAEVVVRPGTSDAGVAIQAFVHGYHVPPFELERPHVVWDLGSNIGLTVAHYACLYPAARIVGVEPDPENAALAMRNVAPWSGRCTILECAVWHEDAELEFERCEGQELAGRAVEGRSATSGASHVPGRSLTTLLDGESTVDLLKVDIEGAERAVFRHNTQWAEKVRHVIVEVHEPYSVDECRRDLEGLGFSTSINPRFWVSVVGTRTSA